jgi:hypothetical protein
VQAPPLPQPRGPLSERLVDTLRRSPHAVDLPPEAGGDPLVDDDLHVSLYVLYELHYRSFDRVADEWEWEPSLLAFRGVLERRFEAACRADAKPVTPLNVAHALRQVVDESTGRSLSSHMARSGTLAEMREFAVHRSPYQLKEADPHTWAIPRLQGRAKAALVEIQSDEYGNGRVAAMHSTLFERTLRALGLDPTYGAYLDRVPGVTLATCNLVSMFGLHRRLRGALAGHLAVFEMTSSVPMGRYAAALRRLGVDDEAADFYDVHVDADERHQVTALDDLAAALGRDEPALLGDIVFGAQALMNAEARFAAHLLDSWAAGRSSLLDRAPLVSASIA